MGTSVLRNYWEMKVIAHWMDGGGGGSSVSVGQQCVCGAAVCLWGSSVSVGQQCVCGAAVCLWGSSVSVGQQCVCGAAVCLWGSSVSVGQQCVCGAAVCPWGTTVCSQPTACTMNRNLLVASRAKARTISVRPYTELLT